MNTRIVLFGAFLLLGGLVCLALAYASQWSDRRIRNWPATGGSILSSGIVRTTHTRIYSPGRGLPVTPEPGFVKEPVWALAVEYRYSVSGKDYTGYQATSAPQFEYIDRSGRGPGKNLQKLAAELASGSTREVHYNPEKPESSYLLYTDSPGKMKALTFGAVLIVVGLVMILAVKLSS